MELWEWAPSVWISVSHPSVSQKACVAEEAALTKQVDRASHAVNASWSLSLVTSILTKGPVTEWILVMA